MKPKPEIWWCIMDDYKDLIEFTLSRSKEKCLSFYKDDWKHFHDKLGYRCVKIRVEEAEDGA